MDRHRATSRAQASARETTAPDGVAGRDRVLDAARAFALLVVVVAHSLAWDLSTTTPASVLDLHPELVWVTWTLQILPLFFAAGAVTNRGSWERNPADYLRRRLLRLGAPALVYSALWTALLLPAALVVPGADLVGRFLSQLLWFLGVYAALTAAVPRTVRWMARPVLTLALWLGAIALVDALRWNVHPTIGQLNILLVWGFHHQVGFHLPALRRARAARLVAGAAAAIGTAVALALVGPYSTSLLSRAGDPEPSNGSPPTLVVALYGLGLVLVLAALWPALTRLLAGERVYRVVAGFGARAVGVYLWHIPLVALVVGVAWLFRFWEPALTPVWWLVHAAGFAVVLAAAWALAGVADRGDRAVLAWLARRRSPRVRPTTALAVALPLVLLSIFGTGFGTWWGTGLLGAPSSSAVNLVLLAAVLWALRGGDDPAR